VHPGPLKHANHIQQRDAPTSYAHKQNHEKRHSLQYDARCVGLKSSSVSIPIEQFERLNDNSPCSPPCFIWVTFPLMNVPPWIFVYGSGERPAQVTGGRKGECEWEAVWSNSTGSSGACHRLVDGYIIPSLSRPEGRVVANSHGLLSVSRDLMGVPVSVKSGSKLRSRVGGRTAISDDSLRECGPEC
jgi:hypothetical protein